MTIKEYSIEIYKLLMEVEELGWTEIFQKINLELERSDDKSTYRKIISIYTGMGSFNDLVLYRNGNLCKNENQVLDKLRFGLYNEITKNWD